MILCQSDFHLFGFRVIHIQEHLVNKTAVLEDDRLVAQGRILHIILRKIRQLLRFLALQVVAVHVHPLVLIAVGHEIDLVAVPHREDILSRVLGDVLRVAALKIIDPDIIGLTAAVALPCTELAEDPVIGYLLAVRRKRTPGTSGEGQLIRHTAVNGSH